MKKELNTKARIAAFGGGSASDTPKADSRAPMAPPSSNRGGTEIEDAGAFQEAFECYETYILDGKGNLLGVPLRRGVKTFNHTRKPKNEHPTSRPHRRR